MICKNLIETNFSTSRAHTLSPFDSFSHISQKPKIVLSSIVFTSDLRSESFLAMLLQFS